jgi:hypothetical protein
MKLTCPECSKAIPAADVNIDLAVAKCAACDAVFGFLEHVKTVLPPLKNATPPKRVRVEHWGPDLVLTRRWYTRSIWVVILFCLIWDGFLVAWYTAIIAAMVRGDMSAAAILPLVFPVFHVAVGVWLTYTAAATLLNRTVIEASKTDFSVRHGPLPWQGNRVLRTEEIQYVFCTENERGVGVNNNRRDAYGVWLQLTDGSKTPLARGLTELDEVSFIAHALAAQMGLEAVVA